MANPKAAKHRTAIEKNPAHYIDLRVKPVDDLSDPETTPFRVYYETAAGDCTEYGEDACCSFDDLINDKGYAYPIEDYKADNDIETDDEFDQDDYIVALVKKLEQRTTVLHVSNGNYIIFT